MKIVRWLRYVVGVLMVVFLCLAWYIGLIPIADGPARSGLRHALSLRVLPSTLRIVESGGYSFKDYAFQADITIAPEEFEVLLSGREFSNVSAEHITNGDSVANLIEKHDSFVIDSVWDWSSPNAERKLGDYGPQCTVYSDKDRHRVLITYGAD